MEDKGAEGVDWDGLSLEVLEMIFCRLPVNDLLSCSVMSKNWKKAARDVLKRDRECYAHIKDFRPDIQALNEMIASTNLMEMVNGLHIRYEIKPEKESASAPSSSQQALGSTYVKNARKKVGVRLEEAKQKVRQVLGVQWRYLNLDLRRPRGPAVSRDDASLLREVIFATSGSLEKLVIGKEEDWRYLPCNGNEYSKLKVIQTLNDQFEKKICTEIFSPKYAPKLEEISGGMMELAGNIPVNRFMMKRVKSIWLNPDVKVHEAFGCLSGLRQLRLQHFDYDAFVEGPDQQQQKFLSLVFPLVLRSLDTLEELFMHTIDLFKLFEASEALKFPNLRRLRLSTRCRFNIVREIPALKQMNLAKLCPNLEKVELQGRHVMHHEQTELMIPLEACAGLDQSVMPLEIAFNCSDWDYGMHVQEYLEFFNAVYPNITQVRLLHVKNIFYFEKSCVIWDIKSLEYLEINMDRRHKFPWVLDIFLCGINNEEAKLLFEGRRDKNAKLETVIVPIRPSLFNAKNLKELKITEDCEGRGEIVKHSSVIQITENLPVRYERELKVTFEGSEGFCNKLKQLEAFSGLSSF